MEIGEEENIAIWLITITLNFCHLSCQGKAVESTNIKHNKIFLGIISFGK